MLNVSKMAYPDKEENVLGLFFNEPTKHWHFKYIVKNAKISEQRANYWLKKFVKDRIIKRVKPKSKMPYFIAFHDSVEYKNKKKIFALNKMYQTGLLNKLQSLNNAKTVVIFGSFSRTDWHTGSDIDIFIYGDSEDLKYGTIWMGRELQVHTFKTKKDIKEIRSGLINNVIKGYFVKGDVHDLVEVSV